MASLVPLAEASTWVCINIYFNIMAVFTAFSKEKQFYTFFDTTGGQTALALRLLLATFSSKLSSDINRPFGDEVDSSVNKCFSFISWISKSRLVK